MARLEHFQLNYMCGLWFHMSTVEMASTNSNALQATTVVQSTYVVQSKAPPPWPPNVSFVAFDEINARLSAIERRLSAIELCLDQFEWRAEKHDN